MAALPDGPPDQIGRGGGCHGRGPVQPSGVMVSPMSLVVLQLERWGFSAQALVLSCVRMPVEGTTHNCGWGFLPLCISVL